MLETSPIARGAAHAAMHRCEDKSCQEQLAGQSHVCEKLVEGTTCADVAAYWLAAKLGHEIDARVAHAPDNLLLRGEVLARRRHCFRCHGELGQGGVANRGAFKGYIPGYFGKDFIYLTDGADGEVVREWIITGAYRGLVERPHTGWIAAFFLERQAISMPVFRELPEHEIDLLVNYVVALHALGPLGVADVSKYASLTALPQKDWRPILRTFANGE